MPEKSLIAIVDDDPSIREGVADLLQSMGFATATFTSAEEFLASAGIERTACLITDGRMAGMSGFELHQRLMISGQFVPTILITAFPEEVDRQRALRDGMVCYLPKPFDEAEFLACLRAAIQPDFQSNRR